MAWKQAGLNFNISLQLLTSVCPPLPLFKVFLILLLRSHPCSCRLLRHQEWAFHLSLDWRDSSHRGHRRRWRPRSRPHWRLKREEEGETGFPAAVTADPERRLRQQRQRNRQDISHRCRPERSFPPAAGFPVGAGADFLP